ncbi:MAG: nucleotidyltransferase family protein [Candidatus Acidiferrales bacterium]
MDRPRHISALISALHFEDPRPESLRALSDSEWRQLLAYSDVARLTLILGHACREYLPGWVQRRIAQNLADNAERVVRARVAYQEIADALHDAHAEHLVLKGFSQYPHFISDVSLRPQSDFDLYCPPGLTLRAQHALERIGYRTGRFPECHIADHIPLLIRSRDRHSNGNAFDPEIDNAIDLHFRFWGRSNARFGPGSLDAFWDRRTKRIIKGQEFYALDPLDALAFSSLHALRHLLYGGLVPLNIYEVAYFLHHTANNDSLWRNWLAQHDSDLRPLIAIPSFLAAQWFGCNVPSAVQQEIQSLPALVHRWCSEFGESTLARLFEMNKDAVWLHLGLIDSWPDKVSLLVRRLFPFWLPPFNSRWVQEKDEGGSVEPRNFFVKGGAYFSWFTTRVIRHVGVLPSALWHGLRLWSS